MQRNKMKTKLTFGPLLAVVLVLLLAGTGCTAKVRRAYHERKADKFYLAGDFDKAELEYLNVLTSQSDNRQALARLGNIYYDQGRMQRAAFFLGRAVQMDTNNLDALCKLGFINTAFGRHQDARRAAELILTRNPRDEQAILLLGESAGRKTDIPNIRRQLQGLQQGGDSAAIETALGNLALRENDLTQAESALQKAYALDAKSAPANAALATLSWIQKDLDKAETYFKAAAENSPPQSPFKMQYVRFKMRTGKLEEAKKTLDDILQKAPNYVPAMMALAEIVAQNKKFDECVALLNKVLQRDEYNFEAMLFQAEVQRQQGDLTGALQGLNRLVRLFPQSPLAYYSLATANNALGDSTAALSNVGRALEILPDYVEAQLLQAQLLLKSGNAGPVIVSLEKLRDKMPDNIDAQLLLADAYRIQGRVDDSLAVYRSLEAKYPKNIQLPLLLGAAYLQKRDAAAAQVEFERVLALDPENLTALGELVDADVAQNKFGEAMQRVKGRLAAKPQDIELNLLVAKIYAAQNDTKNTEEVLTKTAAMDLKNPSANLLLAQLYFNMRQYDKSLAKLAAALEVSPKNIAARMMMAQIHFIQKEYEKAAADYEKALEIDPQFSPALNNLACLYADQLKKLDRAYDLALLARKLLPFDPSTADTLGWINFKRGEYSSSLGLLKQSVAKPIGANDPEIQYHYGMAAYMNAEEPTAKTALNFAVSRVGDKESSWKPDALAALAILAVDPQTTDASAGATLEKRVQEIPLDPVALSRLMSIYTRRGDADKAIAAGEKLLSGLPNHIPTTIQLAELYKTKNFSKGYDLARAAYKLAPFDPNAQSIMGRYAYAGKDYKLSASVLNEAVKQMPDNPQALYDLALANFAVGKISEAVSGLDQAARLNAPAPLAQTIRQFSELARALTPSAPAPDAKTIAEALKANPNYLPALMAQAAIAERSGDLATAIPAYEKVLAEDAEFVPAKKALGILYAPDPAKRDRAFELVSQARSYYLDDPALGKALGIILINKGEYERAVSSLRSAGQRLPEDPEVFYYLATAQMKNGDKVSAKSSLQRAIAAKLSGKLADSAQQMLKELK